MRKRVVFGLFPLVLLGAAALVCRVAESPQAGAPVDDRVVTADNTFGFHLFAALVKKQPDRNVFLSPTSIALALQMTYNGAAGETRQAMAKALELQDIPLETVNSANAALLAGLDSPDPKVTLDIANGLWVHNESNLKPDFLQRSRDAYRAEIGSLAGAPASINAWVSRKTHGKIDRLFEGGDLANAVAVLVNAVYFKGLWTNAFAESATQSGKFTLQNGTAKTLPMMHQSGWYGYHQGEHFQAVRLPYGAGQWSMILFLPDTQTPLTTFLAQLSLANWQKWVGQLVGTPGDIALPRFKTEYATGLNDTLTDLGMGIAFSSGQADFTGMMAGDHSPISQVMHKTVVEVNEKGTEAAAATGVVKSTAIIRQPPRFRMDVDRPFVCAIRDDRTGALLFLGAIFNPS